MNIIYTILQLNILNYYYILQVYKYFDLIRTISYHTNELNLMLFNIHHPAKKIN